MRKTNTNGASPSGRLQEPEQEAKVEPTLLDEPELGLAAALRSIGNLLRPGGFGFIAVPTNDSHYARFHALYRREFGPGTGFDAARIGDPSRVDGGADANKLLANFSQNFVAFSENMNFTT